MMHDAFVAQGLADRHAHVGRCQDFVNEIVELERIPPLKVVARAAVTTHGRAHYDRRVLEISVHMFENWAECELTLLHEVAHFTSWDIYRYAGHGPIWQSEAARLGAVPVESRNVMSAADATVPLGVRWVLTCPEGCRVYARSKLRLPRVCRHKYIMFQDRL
jgi:predicted SprT family Zn-dependent metalloprotease